MDRKIKLIWDFRGPAAKKTAEHHAIHLKEYTVAEEVQAFEIAAQEISEFSAIAYMIVNEKDILSLRDSLKPNRATLANSTL